MTDYTGTAGDDRIIGTDGADSFDLSQGGNDTARGGGANDTFYMGGAFTADDRIVGGEGNDIMVLDGDYSAGVTLNLAAVSGVERVAFEAGHEYDIRVMGGEPTPLVELQSHIAADDHLMINGRDSSGLLYESSGLGHETVLGSAGFDDLFLFGGLDSGDRIDGGAGDKDTVDLNGDYSAGVKMTNHTLQNVEILQLSQGFSYDLTFAKATVGDDLMQINGAALGHADTLRIDASKSLLGNVSIDAGGGNDVLIGTEHDDYFGGGKGIDRLTGGGGADELRGGAGADRFVYLHVEDSSAATRDVIYDLETNDVINLKHIDADATTDGDQAFHLVGALGGHAGELTLSYDAGSNLTSISGDVDGDGQADLVIQASGDQTGFANFVL